MQSTFSVTGRAIIFSTPKRSLSLVSTLHRFAREESVRLTCVLGRKERTSARVCVQRSCNVFSSAIQRTQHPET
eukprot:377874-Rhodomonas_salina.6